MLSVGFLGRAVAANTRGPIPINFKVEGVDRQALVFPVNHGKSARVASVPLLFILMREGMTTWVFVCLKKERGYRSGYR